MDNETRREYLDRILFIKSIVTILVWGIPAFAAPLSLLSILNMPTPIEPIYLRFFGGAAIAWGFAYWFARKDPAANRAVLQAGLVDNALPILLIIWFGITGGHHSLFLWLSAMLLGFFFAAFLFLMPKAPRERT